MAIQATDKVKKAHIMEVGPRDGFQSEKQFVPTALKIEVINALSRTGVPEIQITSFVHPKAIPQFVDAEAAVAGMDVVPGVSYRALTPNMRDLDRLLAVAKMHKDFIPHQLDSSLLRAGRGNVLLAAPERQQKIA